MMIASQKNNCPSPEQLSHFLDLTETGVTQPQGADVAEHVKGCASCQHILASYKKLDDVFCAVIAPSPTLAARITAACHAPSCQTSIKPFPWWRTGLGQTAIAAAFLAFAGLTAVTLTTPSTPTKAVETSVAVASPNDVPSTTEPAAAVAGSAAVAVQADEVAPRVAVRQEQSQGLYERGKAAGNINAKDLQSVSLGERWTMAPTGLVRMRLEELPDTVRHIWTVEDLPASRQRLAAASQAMQAPVAWTNDDEKGRLKAVLRLTDSELQQLVDTLGDGQWALVSPYLPQPNAPERVQLTGKRLLYEIILVQRDK